MDTIVTALADQQSELTTILAGFDDLDWTQPSRCEGWTAADVVLHLCQTNEMAIGSASGRFPEALADLTAGLPPAADVDAGAALMVARDRGLTLDALRDRWHTTADDLCAALTACDPHARVTWVAGELSARTLATTRLAETWIHTGDVADAVGADVGPTDRLWHIARLAWRTLPYAFARAGRELSGPVAFDLTGPGGERWAFSAADTPLTTITGDAIDLCLVAARRAEPGSTGLRGRGPDAEAVLGLVRTYA